MPKITAHHVKRLSALLGERTTLQKQWGELHRGQKMRSWSDTNVMITRPRGFAVHETVQEDLVQLPAAVMDMLLKTERVKPAIEHRLLEIKQELDALGWEIEDAA